MKQWLHVTSGRGPLECCWLVYQLVGKVMTEARKSGLSAIVVEAAKGARPETLQSAIIEIEGDQAYVLRFAAEWEGSVKWIGKSMFRPNHKRRNWFAGISIIKPNRVNKINLDQPLRIERMRAAGPGGQHVNKNETAVRVRHIGSGISAVARERRSQHHNRQVAVKRLESLLEKQNTREEATAEQKRWQQHNTLERGNAIRIFKGMDFTAYS